MDETEHLFSSTQAAFTAFDYDCLFLSEILAGLENVSGHYTDCAASLGKLSRTFGDYSALLSSQNRLGHSQLFLGALRDVSSQLDESTRLLGQQLSKQICSSLEQFLSKDKAKRALAEGRSRFETASRGYSSLKDRNHVSPHAHRPESGTFAARSRGQSGGPGNSAQASNAAAPISEEKARDAFKEDMKQAVGMLSVASTSIRQQLVDLSENYRRVFLQFYTTGLEASRHLDVDRIRRQEVQHASTVKPPVAAKERNVMRLRKILSDLANAERAQLAKLETLAALQERTRENKKSAGFEGGEEELQRVFGPLQKATQIHEGLILQLSGLQSKPDKSCVIELAGIYSSKCQLFESVYIGMIKTTSSACHTVESRRKNAVFKSIYEKYCSAVDFFTLRISPLDYLQRLEKQIEEILQIIGTADEAYAPLEETLRSLKQLRDRAEVAKTSSDNTASLIEMNNLIFGFENVVSDNRKLIAEADLASAQYKLQGRTCVGEAKHRLYLFNDTIALTSYSSSRREPGGAQVLVAKGHVKSLEVEDPGATELVVKWAKERQNDVYQVRLGFQSRDEKKAWAARIQSAISSAKTLQVFGVELDVLMKRESERDRNVPTLVTDTLSYVIKNGMDAEGVFRVNISFTRLKKFQADIDSGKRIEFECPFDAAAVLKAWLRDLPDPLLCISLYGEWIALGSKLVADQAEPNAARVIAKKLPDSHFRVAAVLFKTLAHIASNSVANQMTAHNLAIVIAPAILRGQSNDVPSPALFAIIEELILRSSTIFA
eukprot:m51a1_g3555 putative rho gtpase-activating protein 1-like (776) ;mRNA; f:1030212-1033585